METMARTGTIDRPENRAEYYRQYIFHLLNEGDSFMAPADLYHYVMPEKGYEGIRYKANSKRTVEKFYRYFVLTRDEYGKTETYQYYDLYEILRRNVKEANHDENSRNQTPG